MPTPPLHPEYVKGVKACQKLLCETAQDFEEIVKRLTDVDLRGTPRTFNERKELAELHARIAVLSGSVLRIQQDILHEP